MLFDKQSILDHMTQQGNDPQQIQQASQQLPDQVDHEQHGNMLQQFGVDPQRLANQQGGGGYDQGGGQGDQGGQGY